MKKAGVVEPAVTERASSIVFVLKKDESIRFYIDYRRLNTTTVRDSLSIPPTDGFVTSLTKANLFSILNASSGYRQFEVGKRTLIERYS